MSTRLDRDAENNRGDGASTGVAIFDEDRCLVLASPAFSRIVDFQPSAAAGIPVDEVLAWLHARQLFRGLGGSALLRDDDDPAGPGSSTAFRSTDGNGQTIEVQSEKLPGGGWSVTVARVRPAEPADDGAGHQAASVDMLAHIRHGIVLWDRDRRIVAANGVATRLLQAPPGLLVPGRTLEEVTQSALDRGNLGDGRTGPVRAKWLLEQDRALPHIDQRLTRGGRVLEVRSDPTAHGGFVTTYTDVTHLREAEDALLLSKAAAEAANAAKSRFLAAMSTELHTPLRTILGETDDLARGSARTLDTTRVAASTGIIAEAAHTLLGLIDTVLDLARLESGRFDLAEDRVSVPQLVRSVLRRFDAQAAAAEVALVADLPEHMPMLRVDERRLSQALGNIVSNAVKFAGAAGSVIITARRDWTRGSLLLHVRDTGDGIPEPELDRLFEPFAPTGQAIGIGTGTNAGLGLYVGRIIMRAHGGDLTLRSTVGQGTAATLLVPADRVLQDDPLDPI